MKRFRIALVAMTLGVVLSVGACSGSPAAANDPTGTVTAALSAVNSGGVAKLTDFACAARKADIANAFGGGSLAQLEQAGLKAADVFNALSLTFENVKATEVSRTATAAKVHVTGSMKMTFDKDKFKALMKTVLTTQGLPADDATIDAALTAMSAQMSQAQPVDEDIDVVNEGGKWLICDES